MKQLILMFFSSKKLAVFLTISVFYSPAWSMPEALHNIVINCVSCHGEKGIAPQALWPDLAGQNVSYLITELTHFRNGVRSEPTMYPFIKDLTDNEIALLAAYYSGLPGKQSAEVEQLNTAGMHVRAYCISCHGMEGKPVNSEWPNIAGQNKEYLERQLRNFRSGERPGPTMNAIMKNFTDQQIIDVAEYYSQQ